MADGCFTNCACDGDALKGVPIIHSHFASQRRLQSPKQRASGRIAYEFDEMGVVLRDFDALDGCFLPPILVLLASCSPCFASLLSSPVIGLPENAVSLERTFDTAVATVLDFRMVT